MANVEDLDSNSGSDDIGEQFERPTSKDFANYDEVEEGEIFSEENVSESSSSSRCPSPVGDNLEEKIELRGYLTSGDESPALRYPGLVYQKCPESLPLSSLPGLYYIHSIVPDAASPDGENNSSGRIYFSCPNGRDTFIEDWRNRYSLVFPEFEIVTLINYTRCCMTFPTRAYARDEFLSYRSDKYNKDFKKPLDAMIDVELLTLGLEV